jgi:hypothetical protein
MSAEDGWFTISNEFTSVRVRKERTRNGERLEIASSRLGHVIRLDPLELESLTWQNETTFSRLLETPYGPDEEGEARPLSDLFVLEAGPPASWMEQRPQDPPARPSSRTE